MESQQMSESINCEPRENRFAKISLWCGIIGIFCLPALYSPLLAILPIASALGFLSGIVGLVLFYWPHSAYEGVKQAWIGCALCAITFCVAGHFYAQFMNYVQQPRCAANQREIALTLQLYAKDHGGYLPKSLHDIDYAIPVEKRFCRKYFFYTLHKTNPYILNAHLAGRNMLDFDKYPSQTILTTEGKDRDAVSFSNRSEMALNNHGSVTFLDGHYQRFSLDTIDKHFPTDGKVTEDTWFIKPPQGLKP